MRKPGEMIVWTDSPSYQDLLKTVEVLKNDYAALQLLFDQYKDQDPLRVRLRVLQEELESALEESYNWQERFDKLLDKHTD